MLQVIVGLGELPYSSGTETIAGPQMPRYFFHVEGESPDSDGLELADIAAARAEAIAAAAEMLREWDGDLPGNEWTMVVNEADRPVLTLQFRAIEHAT